MMLALLGFVALVLIMLSHLNPPDQGTAEAKAPGNIIVEARWPDEMDADVDLWVRAPGDVPVGYSNLNGKVFNLLRDDLGRFADFTELNFENAYTRGAVPGEYVVNLHLYRGNTFPVPVRVQILNKRPSRPTATIAKRSVELAAVGQEITVARFTLDDKGALVPGSVHDLPTVLRALRDK